MVVYRVLLTTALLSSLALGILGRLIYNGRAGDRRGLGAPVAVVAAILGASCGALALYLLVDSTERSTDSSMRSVLALLCALTVVLAIFYERLTATRREARGGRGRVGLGRRDSLLLWLALAAGLSGLSASTIPAWISIH